LFDGVLLGALKKDADRYLLTARHLLGTTVVANPFDFAARRWVAYLFREDFIKKPPWRSGG
jgi:hypothetical protein